MVYVSAALMLHKVEELPTGHLMPAFLMTQPSVDHQPRPAAV